MLHPWELGNHYPVCPLAYWLTNGWRWVGASWGLFRDQRPKTGNFLPTDQAGLKEKTLLKPNVRHVGQVGFKERTLLKPPLVCSPLVCVLVVQGCRCPAEECSWRPPAHSPYGSAISPGASTSPKHHFLTPKCCVCPGATCHSAPCEHGTRCRSNGAGAAVPPATAALLQIEAAN